MDATSFTLRLFLPFPARNLGKYSDQLKVADAVAEKKEQLDNSALRPSTKRDKMTSLIPQKKSRQEFPTLVGKFKDKSQAEPLQLKNNAWQHWNLSVLKYAWV